MLIKAGVDISRLRPEIRKKLTVLSPGSLHYANLAIDIRRPKGYALIRDQIKEHLGDDFDVISEKDHIHIEYDPTWPLCRKDNK